MRLIYWLRLESKKTSLLVMIIAIVLVIVVVTTTITLLQKNPQTTTTTMTNQTQTTVDNSSVVVEGRGLRVTLNYSSLNHKLGDVFTFTADLENLNSPSRLTLEWMTMEAYNESGGPVMKVSSVLMWPPGPPKENFPKGQSWPLVNSWNTGSNTPNELPSPTKLKAGNYIFVVKYYYYNLDLGAEEELGLQTSLRISG